MLCQIHHDSFLHFHEIFHCDGLFYTVSEFAEISLVELITVDEYFSEIQLATIACQVSIHHI